MDEEQFQDLLNTLKAIAAALQRAYPRSGFEYDTLRAETEEALVAELNRRAEDGWEAYCISPGRRAWLRRPRKEM
jgi:hypothetical protein